jgi:hypothetical protein
VKVWVNGHERAKQQARKLGLGFTELSSGFASCDDPALLQRICDSLQPGTIEVFFQRWLHRLPLPSGPDDRDVGWWWELSMAQVEVSRTIVFTQPRHARSFFDALVTDNLDLGRPDTLEIIFDRQIRHGPQRSTQETFKTKVITRGTDVTMNAFYRHSRIKQYLKDGCALRIETVINDARDLRCNRRLHNLDELRARARAINNRMLDTERAGQACVLANPVFERIAHPSVTADGRRATAMRFGDSRVQALAGALCHTLCAATGITNRSLRALMTGLPGALTRWRGPATTWPGYAATASSPAAPTPAPATSPLTGSCSPSSTPRSTTASSPRYSPSASPRSAPPCGQSNTESTSNSPPPRLPAAA